MRQLAEVAPGVLVATGQPYTTTSTVVTGFDGCCLVIDPAITVPDVRGLAGELAARGLRADAGWATHPHWDHVLWCAELGDVPRYAAPAAAEAAARDHADLVSAAEREVPGHDQALLGALRPLESDQIPWHGPPAHVIVHAAHEVGHGAVFLPQMRTLIAGDMCSDIEIPLLGGIGANAVARYRDGLDRLASLDVRVVVPGHGHVGDGDDFRRRLAADNSYLDDLAACRPSHDSRITGWLRVEHERQGGMLPG
jgi:glyoxylase-like metal-dependent hydrolase (beta-lactamase superfamily II)